MSESSGFKFSCPYCGQHLEADSDMVGMTIDCPDCGHPLEVPSSDGECKANSVVDSRVETEATTDGGSPKIAIIKRRESFAMRCLKRLKQIGSGIAKLCLVVGVGIIALFCLVVGIGIIAQIADDGENAAEKAEKRKENAEDRKEASRMSASANKKVLSSVKCLLDFMQLPNERRLRVLSDSLQGGPDDFKDAVSEYLVSVVKNPDDMISDKEKEEALQAKAGAAILFGLLGAASNGDSQRGVNAGLELGDMAYAELQGKAKRRLQDEIERKRNRLIEVAQKYGIDSNAFEESLVSRER